MSLLLLVKSWVTSFSNDSWIACEFPKMPRLQMIATTCKTCSLTYFWILQVQREKTTDSVKDISKTSEADHCFYVYTSIVPSAGIITKIHNFTCLHCIVWRLVASCHVTLLHFTKLLLDVCIVLSWLDAVQANPILYWRLMKLFLEF